MLAPMYGQAVVWQWVRATGALAGVYVAGILVGALTLGALVPPGRRRIGDYLSEADAAIARGADGDLFGLYAGEQTPLMWPFALASRIPVVAAGQALDIGGWFRGGLTDATPDQYLRYALGSIAVLAASTTAVAAACWWGMPTLARGHRALLALTSAAVVGWGPVASNAFEWGHPEEVLMGALLCAGVLLLAGGRVVGGAVCVALAVATKQPAVLVLPTLACMVPAGARVRAGGAFGVTLVAATIPFIIGSLGAFVAQNRDATGFVTTHEKEIQMWRLFGDATSWPARHAHWWIVAVAIVLPLVVVLTSRRPLRLAAGCALCVVVMTARLFVDPINIEYYAMGLMGCLVAAELVLTPARHRIAPIGSLICSIPLVMLTAGPRWGGADGADWYLIATFAIGLVALWAAIAWSFPARVHTPGRQRVMVLGAAISCIVGALAVIGMSAWQAQQRLLSPPAGMARAEIGSFAGGGPMFAADGLPGEQERLYAAPYAARPDGLYAMAVYRRGEFGVATIQGRDSPPAASRLEARIERCAREASACAGGRVITVAGQRALARGGGDNWIVSVPFDGRYVVSVSATDTWTWEEVHPRLARITGPMHAPRLVPLDDAG